MTERTLLNLILQYTSNRLNKIQRNVNIGSGLALTMKQTSKYIHFIGDFGLMFILQAFMWLTYVKQ